MNTLRMSVTELDAYRHWKNDEEWMTTEKLIEQLQGKGEANEKMEAGSAWHAQLEAASHGEVLESFERDGFKFNVEIEGDLFLPKIVEVKTEKTYLVEDFQVTLVGMADALHGKTVFDHKLSADFDAEKYIDSLQWRAYLVMFDCDTFVYNVFTSKLKDGECTVTDLNQFKTHRYVGVERDVEAAVRELALFIAEHVKERLNNQEADQKALSF